MDGIDAERGTLVQSLRESEGQEDPEGGSIPGADSGEAASGLSTTGPEEVAESGEPTPTYSHSAGKLSPNRAEVEFELETLSRGPFKRILADYLGFSPNGNSLKRFANKYPDKWANSVGVLAQLAGFKKDVVEVNNIMMIGHMDDAALWKRLQEVEARYAESQRMIEHSDAKIPAELSPSTDPDIIDVKATFIPPK